MATTNHPCLRNARGEVEAKQDCSCSKKLTFGKSPIIIVIGKAFWDVGHAPKDQRNRRKYMPDYAVWEIHPVMALHVDQ
jgi:hypothetical protein